MRKLLIFVLCVTMASAKEDSTKMDMENQSLPVVEQKEQEAGEAEVAPDGADQESSSDKTSDKTTEKPSDKATEKPSLAKDASMQMKQSDNKSRSSVSSSGWPTTLKGFGYEFDEEGVLKDIKTGGPFNFMFSEDHFTNQKRYEALGEVITEEVYTLLETRGGLKRKIVPVDAKPSEPQSFIFVSDNWEKVDKLLVLIHGSGVVRAGQWTRKLIINNSLTHGSMLPFIQYAHAMGYGVVVPNTNHNYSYGGGKKQEEGGRKKKIPKVGTPEDHARYVWSKFVNKAAAKKIAIVAHSYGGVCTVSLAREFTDDFLKRVFAIAFTDSVHMMSLHSVKKNLADRFEDIAINWCASDQPLDTHLRFYKGDARRVSAGHTQHEWTTYSSFDSIIKFLEEMDKKGYNTIGVDDAVEVKADDETGNSMETDQEAQGADATKTKEEPQRLKSEETQIKQTSEKAEEATKKETHSESNAKSSESKPSEPEAVDLATKEPQNATSDEDVQQQQQTDDDKDLSEMENEKNADNKNEESQDIVKSPGDNTMDTLETETDRKHEEAKTKEAPTKPQDEVISWNEPPGEVWEAKREDKEENSDSANIDRQAASVAEPEEAMQIGSPLRPDEAEGDATHQKNDTEKTKVAIKTEKTEL